jgi:drug/metabolite transporter (DMT)-like permease
MVATMPCGYCERVEARLTFKGKRLSDKSSGGTRIAFLVMLVAPLFFSTNLIFGRGVIGDVSPFTLALMRWAAVVLVLSPFLIKERTQVVEVLAHHWRLMFALGFLGMWICGGAIYLALQWTTATNGTLIYTTSPVLILLLEALLRGRAITAREGIGAVLAFAGIVVIVLRGDPAALLALDFNIGDLIIFGGAISWAIYSILYREPGIQRLSTMTLLALAAAAGCVLLVPAAAIEWFVGARLPATPQTWGAVAGIVIFSSLLAFLSFQFGVRRLGASVAGVFMYLLPPYGVILAVLFLGEPFESFHMAGISFVMGGVILATYPAKRAAS